MMKNQSLYKKRDGHSVIDKGCFQNISRLYPNEGHRKLQEGGGS